MVELKVYPPVYKQVDILLTHFLHQCFLFIILRENVKFIYFVVQIFYLAFVCNALQVKTLGNNFNPFQTDK